MEVLPSESIFETKIAPRLHLIVLDLSERVLKGVRLQKHTCKLVNQANGGATIVVSIVVQGDLTAFFSSFVSISSFVMVGQDLDSLSCCIPCWQGVARLGLSSHVTLHHKVKPHKCYTRCLSTTNASMVSIRSSCKSVTVACINVF